MMRIYVYKGVDKSFMNQQYFSRDDVLFFSLLMFGEVKGSSIILNIFTHILKC